MGRSTTSSTCTRSPTDIAGSAEQVSPARSASPPARRDLSEHHWPLIARRARSDRGPESFSPRVPFGVWPWPESVTWQDRESLPFRQMARGNDQIVTLIKRCDFTKVEALGQGDHASVDRLES